MTCSLNKFCANSLKEVVTAEVRKCFLTRIVLLVELPLETWLCEKSFFRKEAQTHIGNLQTDNISGTASPSKCFSTFSAFYCPWPLSVIAVGMDSLSLLPFIWPIFLPVIPLTLCTVSSSDHTVPLVWSTTVRLPVPIAVHPFIDLTCSTFQGIPPLSVRCFVSLFSCLKPPVCFAGWWSFLLI